MNLRYNIRLTALFPVLLTLSAFILSMLCIFAGSKKGYLESADLLTLNTSMIGQRSIPNAPKTSSSTLKSVGNDAKKGLNKAVGNAVKSLNIHDFYSAHVLNYCEGYYTPSPVSNSNSHPKKDISSCSNPTAFFHFDPTSIISKELKHGVSLTDLKWPSAIQETIRVVELSSKALFLFYAAGVITTGLAFLGALIGLRFSGRFSAIANVATSGIAFFCLMIASAISTAIINQIVDSVNIFGKDVGIEATKGTTFIGMSWAATLLILVSGFAWVVEFIRGRRAARFGYAVE